MSTSSAVVSWKIDTELETKNNSMINAIDAARHVMKEYLAESLDEYPLAKNLCVEFYGDEYQVDLSDSTVHLDGEFVGGWIFHEDTGLLFYYQDKDDYVVIYDETGKHIAGVNLDEGNDEWSSFHNRIDSKDYSIPTDKREQYEAVGYCVEILSKWYLK